MHVIGTNYRPILKTRKNKKQLPLIGRLKKTIDIDAVKEQILHLLHENENKLDLELDPSATEHTYNLKNKSGEYFVKNYDDVYKKYSTIGFQELSFEAKSLAASMSSNVSDFSPVQRLKGMTDTSSKYYHPHYDERNYTQPTEYCTGYIKEFLHSFKSTSCRSAVVALHPGRFLTKHFDIGAEYVTRLQIPIVTNQQAVIGVKTENGWNEYHLPADGSIFFINAGYEHYAINAGSEVRYQVRVCLQSQEDLEGMEDHTPSNFISDEDFVSHPCYGGSQNEFVNIAKQAANEFNLKQSGKASFE